MIKLEAQRNEEQAQLIREYHPKEEGLRETPIGLAVSGGGTRAAAFHCGVLWALADAGLLKDVTQMSAVSGGAYTAGSYMSHLFHLSSEASEFPSLDAWYQHVMTRTVLRMQRNINYIVDISPNRLFRLPRPEDPEEAGSSVLPRILDLPLFILTLAISIMLPPILLVINTVWPIVLHIDMYHGEQLRSVWCDPQSNPMTDPWVSDWLMNRLIKAACFFLAALGLNIISWVGLCHPKNGTKKSLVCRSIRHCVERFAIVFLAYSLLIPGIYFVQGYSWGSATMGPIWNSPDQMQLVRALCHRYVDNAQNFPIGAVCSDQNFAEYPWFEGEQASLYHNYSWVAEHATAPHGMSLDTGSPLESFERSTADPSWIHSQWASWWLIVTTFTVIVLVFIGGTLMKWVATLLIPIGYLYLITIVARWRVYGPITGQMLIPYVKSSRYSAELSMTFFTSCLVMAFITLPVYDTVLRLMHLYYRRALKHAFFFGGKDVSCASIATCPFCPNMLLAGCMHDYKKPGEKSAPFCQFTISSLFLGCPRTGFFFTPSQARLAHLLTVAGAATDASLLIEMDILFIRFLMTVFAMRFGDFLRLQPVGETAVRVSGKIKQLVIPKVEDIFRRSQTPGNAFKHFKNFITQEHDEGWLVHWLQSVQDRMPASVPVLLCQLVLWYALRFEGSSQEDCKASSTILGFGFSLWSIILVSGFFTYLRPLQFLSRSPMIRQFQMIMMHVTMAPTPPPYVYVSDGGLLEVTGLLPLLKRRMKKIVVSDAAEDPHLTMRCLRDLAAACRKENICSFFDPRDPRRDLEFVIRDMPTDGKACLHLGIRYEGSAEPLEGEIFYVRMRVPPEDSAPIRRLLTEDDLKEPVQPFSSAAQPQSDARWFRPWGDVCGRKDMGGTCMPWCECGGLMAKRRFPHYSMSNQFLTPLHFANLCALGAELAQPLFRKGRGVYWSGGEVPRINSF